VGVDPYGLSESSTQMVATPIPQAGDVFDGRIRRLE
jgi:hypothetical protein